MTSRLTCSAWVIALVGTVSLLCAVAAEPADHMAVETARLAGLYGYADWPGKDGPVYGGFKVGKEGDKLGLRMGRVGIPDASIDTEDQTVRVRRTYEFVSAAKMDCVEVAITVAETRTAAQKELLRRLVSVSIAQPPLTPRSSVYGIDLGDICYGGPDANGVINRLHWVHGSVFVDMLAEGVGMSRFLLPVAHAIDTAIAERPQYETYSQCSSRPVISSVRRRHADSWQEGAVQAAEGELYHTNSRKLFANDTQGWPVTFPVVVTEDNLVGFPLPRIAHWRENHLDAAQVNGGINTFLERFRPPAD